MNAFIVLVPVYKYVCELTDEEIKSIRQTYSVFGNESVRLIIPQKMAVENYDSIFFNKVYMDTFPDEYFVSTNSYNKLLTASFFYKRYLKYDWLLICQMDAYVLKHTINDFLSRTDYFFIGAPVMDTSNKEFENQVWVGNGGLSMRKTNICYEICIKLEKIKCIMNRKTLSFLYGNNILGKIGRNIFSKIYGLNLNKYALRYAKGVIINEDIFWCQWIPQIFHLFKPADIYTASRFSFEMNPSEIYSSTKTLPFGCHAWQKHDVQFWSKFIQ